MHYTEAVKRLEAEGIRTSISIENDSPVELLFWSLLLNGWDHWCNIGANENIDENAADDIRELY